MFKSRVRRGGVCPESDGREERWRETEGRALEKEDRAATPSKRIESHPPSLFLLVFFHGLFKCVIKKKAKGKSAPADTVDEHGTRVPLHYAEHPREHK